MNFFLVAIATDKNGNDIIGPDGMIVKSTYAITSDKEVARLALEVFRSHQSEDRSTYAPGTICSVSDRAYRAELMEKEAVRIDLAAQAEVDDVERIFSLMDI